MHKIFKLCIFMFSAAFLEIARPTCGVQLEGRAAGVFILEQ